MSGKEIFHVGYRHGCFEVVDIVAGGRRRAMICRCDCGEIERIPHGLSRRSKSCHHNKPDGRSLAMNSLYKAYMKSARIREIDFSLTLEQFTYLAQSKCYYCGASPSRIHYSDTKRRTSSYTVYNGVDRYDNDIGYTVFNSRSCCTNCNYGKRAMSAEAYIAHCARVTAHAAEAVRSIFD